MQWELWLGQYETWRGTENTSSKRQADTRYWSSCSFTHTIEPSGCPQCTATLQRPRRLATECTSNHLLTPVAFRHTSKESAGGPPPLIPVLESPSSLGLPANLQHIRCPEGWAGDVVSRRCLCCMCWKRAHYFLATVHWLCGLDKNEDAFHCVNELDCHIKEKCSAFFSVSLWVSLPPGVGPSIYVL